MSMGFIALFLSLVFLPGYALQYAVASVFKTSFFRQHLFLCSFATSYALFAILLLFAQWCQWSLQSFIVLQALVLLSSCLLIVVCHAKHANPLKSVSWLKYGAPLVIVVGVTLYHAVVGPYAEIPADIYAHLGYLQRAMYYQQSNILGVHPDARSLLQQTGLVWYHLVALCIKLSNLDVQSAVYITTWLTKTIFLLGVYCFAMRVFIAHKFSQWIAVLTTVLLAVHMGINVMAYVRYYSFAPTMLNFVIYFAAIATFLQFLQAHCMRQAFALITLLGFFTLAAAAIHTQEALFILIMVALIALCDVLRKGWRYIGGAKPFSSDASYGGLGNTMSNSLLRYSSVIVLVCAALCFIGLYSYAQLKLERAPNVGWRLWEFGRPVDWLPQISVLNLKYQFIRTITLWGVLVYLCTLVAWRDVRGNLFLVAGLLSPVFTLLNPLFVDLFLRVESSTTLWRMAYIIPVHFVAALLIVNAVVHCFVSHANRGQAFYRDQTFDKSAKNTRLQSKLEQRPQWRQVVLLCMLALSILLLLPIKNTYQGLHYSRFPTLAPVAAQNSFEHLQDVIDALNAIEEKHTILTDPVTGYVISGLTHHHSYRHKFFPRSYIPFSFSDYSKNPLRSHQGRLLLVNQRSHALSQVGALANHWPETILRLERYYPDVLLTHLQSKPEQFQLLWASADQDLLLYKVRVMQN